MALPGTPPGTPPGIPQLSDSLLKPFFSLPWKKRLFPLNFDGKGRVRQGQENILPAVSRQGGHDLARSFLLLEGNSMLTAPRAETSHDGLPKTRL